MQTGCNFGRLLKLAMEQAGAELPDDLRPLMVKGREQAECLLAPAIEFPDGRSFSDFDMFQEYEP
jgi:hypothetical protein